MPKTLNDIRIYIIIFLKPNQNKKHGTNPWILAKKHYTDTAMTEWEHQKIKMDDRVSQISDPVFHRLLEPLDSAGVTNFFIFKHFLWVNFRFFLFFVIIHALNRLKLRLFSVLPDFPCRSFLPSCWWGFSEWGRGSGPPATGGVACPIPGIGDLNSPYEKMF